MGYGGNFVAPAVQMHFIWIIKNPELPDSFEIGKNALNLSLLLRDVAAEAHRTQSIWSMNMCLLGEIKFAIQIQFHTLTAKGNVRLVERFGGLKCSVPCFKTQALTTSGAE